MKQFHHDVCAYLCIFSVCVTECCSLVPFLQVMAGFGAPLVWQANRAVFPSVTVWSDGGDVNVGAIPETGGGKRRAGWIGF